MSSRCFRPYRRSKRASVASEWAGAEAGLEAAWVSAVCMAAGALAWHRRASRHGLRRLGRRVGCRRSARSRRWEESAQAVHPPPAVRASVASAESRRRRRLASVRLAPSADEWQALLRQLSSRCLPSRTAAAAVALWGFVPHYTSSAFKLDK